MAIYDYKCDKCNIKKENVMHSIKESPEIKCDKCNGIMNIIITGGSGYIMEGGTRKKSIGTVPSHVKDIVKHQADTMKKTQGGL